MPERISLFFFYFQTQVRHESLSLDFVNFPFVDTEKKNKESKKEEDLEEIQ